MKTSTRVVPVTKSERHIVVDLTIEEAVSIVANLQASCANCSPFTGTIKVLADQIQEQLYPRS